MVVAWESNAIIQIPALPRTESNARIEDVSSLPPVCRPSSFKNYRSFVDKRRFEKRSLRSDSKTECCMTCQEIGDCFSFEYNMAKSLCNYYVSMGKVAKKASKSESKVCPSGLGAGYMELPNYPLWPSHFGHEHGPCLSSAAASGRGPDLGLDLQAVSDQLNQQILDLPKEDLGLEDDEDEDEIYELR
ncbi:uncharacterized protein KY384_002586 [Bacidia gigantensis]|uniref:uncharacterized protein n=1 Tax=Bacidia gigantensis TaxID=2732470 RepID=UPI001D04876F|nr:uncharacterized protein KY384_002586 [Bacidia gigantensis]KAG8532709.1 hypothetical protein KY384_002586 [Bacidia gigantensis]